MLDLDSLATQKARRLNQGPELWLNAVWSPAFQRFSSNLSDGEVEQVVAWCPSVAHLQALVGFLESKAKEAGLTPFPCLVNLAKEDKVSPEDWIKSHLPLSPES
jgi:hypothetical protein